MPTRSDYQVLNELSNGLFRALLALTTHDKPENRKHLIVTATDMSIEEDDRTVWEGPSLTKTSAKEAVQMFQQVGTIQIKPQLVDGKRTLVRSLTFQGDGVKALKDRYDVFPGEIPLRKNPQSPGEDLLTMYEKWWLPKLSEVNTNV